MILKRSVSFWGIIRVLQLFWQKHGFPVQSKELVHTRAPIHNTHLPPCSPCGEPLSFCWQRGQELLWRLCWTRCWELAGSLNMTHSVRRRAGFPLSSRSKRWGAAKVLEKHRPPLNRRFRPVGLVFLSITLSGYVWERPSIFLCAKWPGLSAECHLQTL